MTKPRDTQRSRVYAAEEDVRAYAPEPEVSTIKGIGDFAAKVIRSSWFRSRFHTMTVLLIGDGRGRGRACGGPLWKGAHIKMPKWCRSRMLVLHEIAHCVEPQWQPEYRLYPHHKAAHGPEFCRIYLSLVQRFLGVETAKLLRDSFRVRKVKVGPVLKSNPPLVRQTLHIKNGNTRETISTTK